MSNGLPSSQPRTDSTVLDRVQVQNWIYSERGGGYSMDRVRHNKCPLIRASNGSSASINN